MSEWGRRGEGEWGRMGEGERGREGGRKGREGRFLMHVKISVRNMQN